MSLYGFIVLLHIIGTILGTGGATVAEVQITRALRDKNVSPDESALMHMNYSLIRVGLGFIVVSAFAMIWYHLVNNSIEVLLSNKVLFKEFLVVVIIANAVAIGRRWVPLWLGAATSFTSWWGATILGVAGPLPYNFLTFLAGFIVSVLAVAAILHYVKKLTRRDV